VPNLIADRALFVARPGIRLNVRRLMYQSLIWRTMLSHESSRLAPPRDLQDVESLPYALVDRMRRNPELDRDFL
jgi:hypothetical protein